VLTQQGQLSVEETVSPLRMMGPTQATVGVEESPMAPEPTPVPSWQLIQGQGKGTGGDGGRRVVAAYHCQLQVPGVVL